MNALTELTSRLYDAQYLVLVLLGLYVCNRIFQYSYKVYRFRNRYTDIISFRVIQSRVILLTPGRSLTLRLVDI